MERLDDRIAIATGATRGVGAAIAGRMIEVGARVVLVDIRHGAGVGVASKLGAAATYLPLDVTREEDWRRAVDATSRGVVPGAPRIDSDDAEPQDARALGDARNGTLPGRDAHR